MLCQPRVTIKHFLRCCSSYEEKDYNVDLNASRERGHTVLHKERLLFVLVCGDDQANTWNELGLTLSGELLSVDVAS